MNCSICHQPPTWVMLWECINCHDRDETYRCEKHTIETINHQGTTDCVYCQQPTIEYLTTNL